MNELEHKQEMTRLKHESWMDYIGFHVVISVVAVSGYLIQTFV